MPIVGDSLQFNFPQQCCSCLAPPTGVMSVEILEKGQSLFSPPIGIAKVPICEPCRQRLSRLFVVAVVIVILWLLAGGTFFLLALNKVIPLAFFLGLFIAVLSARRLLFVISRTPARFIRRTYQEAGGVKQESWQCSFRNKGYQKLFNEVNPAIIII